MGGLRILCVAALVIASISGAQAQSNDQYVASIKGYAIDYTDGSIGEWNSVYPYLSFDDEKGRRGEPNGVWKGSYYVRDNKLTLIIDDLTAPNPPAHTLGVGYTVSLKGATFEDGATKKDFILFTYSRQPTQRYIEKTVPIIPIIQTALSITKIIFPYSIRQFQETTIKVSIENKGTTDVKAIEIMDSIHPSFDIISGDFPNPKKYDIIRQGESREIQYTIKAKESGSFTIYPATVTYADKDGNIQEVKSEPVSIKVIPSSEGVSGAPSGQPSKLSASVSLTGEKTDVVLGEDILLKLSAVNLITKPKMRVQVIIIPPSGMSVTSSEFSKSGTNQFTANYELEPGDGKDIGVAIKPNQIGDFNVNGRIRKSVV